MSNDDTNDDDDASDTVCVCASIDRQDPCYHLALGMLQKDHRLRVVGVPIDEQGMRVDELERLIEQHLSTPEAQQYAHDDRAPTLKRHQYRAFLYTIPTYHNPTGVTLSDSRRRVLVDLAVRHNIAVLADEVGVAAALWRGLV